MPTQHLAYLDGWRGLAIASLLIGHFFPVPGINLGTFGVNLFFVLSGLLMAGLLFEKRVPIDLFYKRRISRIFPAVYGFIFLLVVGYLIADRKVDWPDVAAAATFTNNYFEGRTGPWRMPLGHIWSLCVEEHSYVILTLVAIVSRRKLADARLMVWTATTLAAAIGIFYYRYFPAAKLGALNLHTEVAAFGIFVSAALLLSLRSNSIEKLPASFFFVLVGGSLALHWWSIPAPVRTIAGVGALALAINLLFAAPAWMHKALAFAPLRQLGLWSFSLYVWQQPFYMYYRYYGMNRYVAFALAIACGVASFYLIEQPCRRWLNERWKRQDTTEGIQPAIAPAL